MGSSVQLVGDDGHVRLHGRLVWCGSDPAVRDVWQVLSHAGGVLQHVHKDDRRSTVLQIEVGGRAWFVKRYQLSPMRAFWSSLTHRSPAWRELRAGLRLKYEGIACCPPEALVRLSKRGGDLLLMPAVPGDSLVHLIRRFSPVAKWTDPLRRRRLAVAAAMGCQIAQHTRADLVNRDYKLSNLMLDDQDPEATEPVVIDPLGVRRRRGDDSVHQMLESLLRSIQGQGPVTSRELFVMLRALVKVDPSIHQKSGDEAARLRSLWRICLARVRQ